MRENLRKKVARYLADRKRHKRMMVVLPSLALAVCIATAACLSLPAFTLENSTESSQAADTGSSALASVPGEGTPSAPGEGTPSVSSDPAQGPSSASSQAAESQQMESTASVAASEAEKQAGAAPSQPAAPLALPAAQPRAAAPNIVPTPPATSNAWQVVSGLYTGNANTDKSGVADPSGLADPPVKVQKNVIPTGEENKFFVYLSVDKKLDWDQVLNTSLLKCTTQGKWESADIGTFVNESEIGGKKNALIPKGNPGFTAGDRQVTATVHFKQGGREIRTTQITYSGYTPGNSSHSWYLLLEGVNPNALFVATKLMQVSDTAIEFDMDLDQIGAKADYAVYPIDLDTVTDEMGARIAYLNSSYSDGLVEPQTDGGTGRVDSLVWTPEENPEVTGTNLPNGNDGVTGYYQNVCQLLYQVQLQVEGVGFVSSADALDATEGPTVNPTNGEAVLNWHFREAESGPSHEQPFSSPEVRGMLYDLELTKVSQLEQGGEAIPLPGVTFALYRGETEQEGEQPLATSTTGPDGKLRFEDLPWGTYRLKETQVPAGFEMLDAPPVTLCYTTHRDKLTVPDPAKRPNALYAYGDFMNSLHNAVDLTIYKNWIDYGTDRPGSIAVAVYKNEEQTPVKELVLAPEGSSDGSWSYEAVDADSWKFIVKGLPLYEVSQDGDGKHFVPVQYRIEEKPLPGYNPPEIVQTEGKPYEFTITNEFQVKLPATGGSGTWIFPVFGGGLMVSAAAVLSLRRRKQK